MALPPGRPHKGCADALQRPLPFRFQVRLELGAGLS
jgi:hypothetical protein